MPEVMRVVCVSRHAAVGRHWRQLRRSASDAVIAGTVEDAAESTERRRRLIEAGVEGPQPVHPLIDECSDAYRVAKRNDSTE